MLISLIGGFLRHRLNTGTDAVSQDLESARSQAKVKVRVWHGSDVMARELHLALARPEVPEAEVDPGCARLLAEVGRHVV
jgi:hypothetical protein